jgi:hypothetical protein
MITFDNWERNAKDRGDGGLPEFWWERAFHRRSALGPTGHETSPPCALKIFHHGVAIDACGVGGDLGSRLPIEFGAAAIASSPHGHIYARTNDSDVLSQARTETFL